jgi:hypothetical protein
VGRAVTCLRMAPMRRPYVFRWNVLRRAEDGLEGSSHRHACRYGGGWSFGGGLISKSASPRSKGSFWPRSIEIRTPFERSTGSDRDQPGVRSVSARNAAATSGWRRCRPSDR